MPVRKATPQENERMREESITLGPDAARAEVERATATVPAIVERARAIEVRSEAEAIEAGTFLVEVKEATTQAETARKALVKPLNDHVKFINQSFKEKTGPLAEADEIVRGKVVAYEREQDRLRRAEQERLQREAEEQRQREEAEARAAREAAEAAAAAAAEAAAETSRAEQDEASDLAMEVRDLTDDALIRTRDALGEDGGLLASIVAAEMERRDAEAAATRARVEAEAAQAAEAEIAARPVEQVQADKSGPIRADGGTVSTVRRKTYRVVDESRVPRRFLVIDHKAMNAAVQAGEEDIPGVEIDVDISVAVRAAA